MAERRWKEPPPPITTIGEIARGTDWVWLHCTSRKPTGADCGHRSALRLEVTISKYGIDASTDRIRRSARCSACGGKGAMTMAPTFLNVSEGWQKYPGR